MSDLLKNILHKQVLKLNQEDRDILLKELIESFPEEPKKDQPKIQNAKTENDEYLKLLRRTYDYGQEEFDKNILYVSSSALGLTLAFIEKIVKLENAISKDKLWTGWCLLGSTIILYVLSHLVSSLFMQKLISDTKDSMAKRPEDVVQKTISNKISNIFGTAIVNFSNLLLYSLMSLGIIYIILFLHNNLIK